MSKYILHMQSGDTYQCNDKLQTPIGRQIDSPIDMWFRNPDTTIVIQDGSKSIWTKLSSVEAIEEIND